MSPVSFALIITVNYQMEYPVNHKTIPPWLTLVVVWIKVFVWGGDIFKYALVVGTMLNNLRMQDPVALDPADEWYHFNYANT